MISGLLLLFVVAIANVFVLAFQSRNINSGQYTFAAMGSIGIGMSQAFIWKAVTTTGWFDALVYSIGGGIGCVSAMYVHRRFIGERKPRKDTSYGELRYRAANPEEFKNG